MPVMPTYPGVYIEEIPSGVRTVVGVATSITAFIGRAPRGPVEDPFVVNSYGDYERSFGKLHTDYAMSYAVRDFYLNGGSQALIVRLFKGADGKAKLTWGDLNLEAASPGKWGENVAITLDYDGIDDETAQRFGLATDDLFNLTVMDGTPGGTRERVMNLSVNKDAGPRRIDRALGRESQLIRVQLKDDGTPDLSETASRLAAIGDAQKFTLGADSESLDVAAYEGSKNDKSGLYALDKADLFNLLCIPPDRRGDDDTPSHVYQTAMAYCAERRAMLIVDPPYGWSKNKVTAAQSAKTGLSALGLTGPAARNAALYFPRVRQADSLREGQIETFAPCGIVAGIMARTDVSRGVWKAPAGLDASINGIVGLEVNLTDNENGMLNPLGINVLRFFPAGGPVLWGARTMRGADQLADEYKYVPVRRLALFIEESLYRGTQWVVFEPNDEPLWAQIRLNVGAFMHNLFRQGAFQGKTPREAYFVKCDGDTTTQNDINQGIVNIIVGFAPLKPA
jgi:uncharacterized protein